MTPRLERVKVHNAGWVDYVTHLGDDKAIAHVARVSTGAGGVDDLAASDIYGGDRTLTEADRRLIRYLVRHRHTSPIEFCQVVFHIRAPIFVWRQWHRHRTASYSEESDRYRVKGASSPLEFYEPKEFRAAGGVKQGSAGVLTGEAADNARVTYGLMHNNTDTKYGDLIRDRVAPEMARMGLPQSEYKTCLVSADLHNMFHFLSLRLDPHAQKEIRDYAEPVYTMIRRLFPEMVEAFEEYVLNAATFSAKELRLLRMIGSLSTIEFDEASSILGFTDTEIKEFGAKLYKGVDRG